MQCKVKEKITDICFHAPEFVVPIAWHRDENVPRKEDAQANKVDRPEDPIFTWNEKESQQLRVWPWESWTDRVI